MHADRRALLCVAAALGQLALLRAVTARGEDAELRARAPVARITAVRTAELAEDPSSFQSVIEASDFADENSTTEELISRAVGVQVRRFGGPGQLAEISIRGSSASQVVVLLDGVRLNNALSGSVDLSSVPLELVERIEISRGGGSVQVGSDAVGGVINIVTKQPTEGATASARLLGGSFGTWEGSATAQGRVKGTGLALGYDGFKTDGDWRFQTAEFVGGGGIVFPSRELERINNRSETHAALARLSREIVDGVELRASNQFFYGSRGQPGFASGGGATGGQAPFAHERRTRNLADLELEWGDEATWALRGFHRWERLRFRDPQPPIGAPRESDDRNTSMGTRFAVEGDLAALRTEHGWSLGSEVRRDSLVSDTFDFQSRWVVGLFAQDEIGLFDGLLLLVPALRFDYTEGFGDEWLPRLGLVLEPRPWLRAKANLERSYRVPNFDELFHPDEGFVRGNPSLQPELAFNVDGGFQLVFEQLSVLERVELEVAGFRNDIENTIVFVRINANTIEPQNINDVLVRGIELSGGFEVLGGWLGFGANWTRLWTEVAGTGAPLPGRPENEVSVRLQAGPPSKLVKLVTEWHGVSEIPVSRSGNTFVSARSTWDLSASLDLRKLGSLLCPGRGGSAWLPNETPLSFRVTNVGDVSVQDARGAPQPGRAFSLALEGRW